jgi:hypothetical protein
VSSVGIGVSNVEHSFSVTAALVNSRYLVFKLILFTFEIGTGSFLWIFPLSETHIFHTDLNMFQELSLIKYSGDRFS